MIMPELSSVFSLVNYAFVLFFGIVAALYLADIGFCDHKRVYVLTLFFFGIAQLLFYLIMGESVLYKCYPFLIHIPLIALIFLRFHRNLSISAISVLSAYLLCTPRKWFGTFVAFFFDRNPVVSNIASIIITIPLLVLVIRFVSPYIIRLKYESRTTLLLFFLLPLVYYVLEYTFTVYTDLLYTGGAVVIDFMDSPGYEELCRRFLADAKDFSEENLKNAGITRRFENKDMNACLEEIKLFIQKAILI